MIALFAIPLRLRQRLPVSAGRFDTRLQTEAIHCTVEFQHNLEDFLKIFLTIADQCRKI